MTDDLEGADDSYVHEMGPRNGFWGRSASRLLARVKELERKLELGSGPGHSCQMLAGRLVACETERDAANADRARLREALNAWESWAATQAEGEPKTWPPFVQSGEALRSSDASAWLRERERAVAERVAAEYERKLDMAGGGSLDIDLDALVGGGE